MSELRKKILSRLKASFELSLCHLNLEHELTSESCEHIAQARCMKEVYDHYFEILDASWFDETAAQSKLAYAVHFKEQGPYMETLCNWYRKQIEATGSDLFIYAIASAEYLPVLWSRTKLESQEAAVIIRVLGGQINSMPAGNSLLVVVDANLEIQLFKEKLNGCHTVNQFFADDVL